MNTTVKDIQNATEVVLEKAKEINGEWTPDWDDSSKIKYFVSVDDEGDVLVDYNLTGNQTSTVYFPSREKTEEFIDSVDTEVLVRYITQNY